MVSQSQRISYERMQISYRIMKASERVPQRSTSRRLAKTFFIHGMWLFGAKWNQSLQTITELSDQD